MPAVHLELLVEEPSMEAFLRALLPRLLPQPMTARNLRTVAALDRMARDLKTL
mgnify:CR=1 FL=1